MNIDYKSIIFASSIIRFFLPFIYLYFISSIISLKIEKQIYKITEKEKIKNLKWEVFVIILEIAVFLQLLQSALSLVF